MSILKFSALERHNTHKTTNKVSCISGRITYKGFVFFSKCVFYRLNHEHFHFMCNLLGNSIPETDKN